jgi:hypothetical protein
MDQNENSLIGNVNQQAVILKQAELDRNFEVFKNIEETLRLPDWVTFYPIPVGLAYTGFDVNNLPGFPNYFALVSENTGEFIQIVPGTTPINGSITSRPVLTIANLVGPGTFALDTPALPYTAFTILCSDFVGLTSFTPYLIIGYKNPLR